jgi:predicted CXXCH cytochrome family protein
VVYKPGKSLAQFMAADRLEDFAVYFVRAQQAGGGGRATSQYEALLRSACKRASGDRLTCTTCHDPHSDPAPAERVAYFRARCLSCHTSEKMAAHHVEQPDCAACHMPSRRTTDISHEQVTDHDIEARPAGGTRLGKLVDASELVPVGGFAASDRTLGMAYAQMAERGEAGARDKALKLLSAAAQGESDPEMEVRLGYLRQTAGQLDGARAAYVSALAADPYDPVALANLAVLDAGSGHMPEAIRLLERLTDNDPSQTAAGLNLAFIECRFGKPKEGLALAMRLLEVNPDYEPLRTFVQSGEYAGQQCSLAAAK